MKAWLALFIVTALVASPCLASYGVVTSTNVNSLQNLAAVLVEVVEAKLISKPIPDIPENFNIPVIGQVDCEFTNVVVTSVSLPLEPPSVSGSSFVFNIGNGEVSLTGSWSCKQQDWPHAYGSGNVGIQASQVDVAVTNNLGATNGYLTLDVSSANVKIGQLNINPSGSNWDGLFDAIEEFFSSDVTNEVQSLVSGIIISTVNAEAKEFIDTLSLSAVLNEYITLDMSVTQAPYFYTDPTSETTDIVPYFYTLNAGVFNPTSSKKHGILSGDLQEDDSPHPDLSSHRRGGSYHDFEVVAYEILVNSGLAVYFEDGLLQSKVTSFPSDVPLKLNTSDWKLIVPSLYEAYPGKAMIIDAQTTVAPTVTLSATAPNAVMTANLTLTVSVDNTADSTPVAFVLGVGCTVSVVPEFYTKGVDLTIVPNITEVTFSMSLITSNIGYVDASGLTKIIRDIFLPSIVKDLNNALSSGLTIPQLGRFGFFFDSISYGDGYFALVFSGNGKYSGLKSYLSSHISISISH